MSSGVAVNDECISKFNDMKLKAANRYIIFKIADDKKSIIVEAEGDKTKTYDDFLAALTKDEPRFAAVDVPITTKDGVNRDILSLITWSPDTCGVKTKMLYASSKDALKKKLSGLAKDSIQCNDEGELAITEVAKQCGGV